MLNTTLFSFRNVLVIVAFAIIWQMIFARVNTYLHASDDATQSAIA